jgi:colanic acid biosynthesis protein WcaH
LLDSKLFKTVIESAPLVAIDLCLVCGGQILLGKRNNDPLKGEWFTPGGRIYKDEPWQSALRRVVEVELGLGVLRVEGFSLMGVWDHFYAESAVGKDISTHYVNLTHCIFLKSKPVVIADQQHNDFQWFDLSLVSRGDSFHPYIRTYAEWLLDIKGGTCD